ncbi:MAG: M24 family metallopeptidase [Rhodothermales bacterium]
MRPLICLLALMALAGSPTSAQDAVPAILSMRERAEVRDAWLERRLETVIPLVMRRAGVDMWVISAREYNEDPVARTMLPATWLNARRRTILLFYDRGEEEGVERLAIARYAVGEAFPAAWDPDAQPDQWARLADVIAERNPERIAINRSSTFALADGMTDSEFDGLQAALPEPFRDRIVSGEALAVGWLETRIPEEMVVYPTIVKIAQAIIAEGFSEQVITPGVTTVEDVEWWYRDRVRELGLVTWFHPTVSIQRAESGPRSNDFSDWGSGNGTIAPGDLLHVDFGITYLGLNTDTQEHAYVLRPGEHEAPAGLRSALATGNRLQDLLTDQFATGRTGNEILAASLSAADREGIEATIYTHPIGFHGHAAGPAIGMWDKQDGVPGTGDYPLYPNTAFSIELNAAVPVPEWGDQKVRIMLEQDAFFDGASVWYIDGRQTDLHLIPRHSHTGPLRPSPSSPGGTQ